MIQKGTNNQPPDLQTIIYLIVWTIWTIWIIVKNR